MRKIGIKKIAAMMLGLMCLAVLAGCGTAGTPDAGTDKGSGNGGNGDKQSAETGYKDGTYEGKSPNGIDGEIVVSVEVAGGKITNVKVVTQHETEGIGSMAVEQLPGKIVEAQSTEMDNVSGATVSSTAIKEAVNDALSQAK